jgi:hypothetical protein
MVTKTMYFTVDPQGVVDLARQVYWFEDKKQHGVDILRCFIGIESCQITRILEGDATITEDRRYVEVSNEDFKFKLKDLFAYRKKYDEANFMWLGGIKVERALVDTYANHVVKRLRDTMRNSKYGIMFEPKDIDEILGLETTRQEMHDQILENAGFSRDDDDEEARIFKNALDKYVDEKAGSLMDVPLEELDPDKVVAMRKTSNDLINYTNSMNGRIAKARGIS